MLVILFGLPFGCFLPKWQDLPYPNFGTLSRFYDLWATLTTGELVVLSETRMEKRNVCLVLFLPLPSFLVLALAAISRRGDDTGILQGVTMQSRAYLISQW